MWMNMWSWQEYYQKNKDKIRAKQRKYYQLNKEKCNAATKKWAEIHKDEMRRYRKEYHEKYKQKYRNNKLQRDYNISLSGYKKLAKQQGNCCAICGISRNRLASDLCVDHDHSTGKIRGLLCKTCNYNLGWYEKLSSLIIEYLGVNIDATQIYD